MDGYCIYLDGLSSDLSEEHIIPLSLGGSDKFTILADRKFNKGPASKVDAGVANDFLMMFDRDKKNALGHSGTKPEPTAKNVTLEDGTPVQAVFAASGLRIYNLKERRLLTPSEASGRTLKVEGITVRLDVDIKFVAKVALSAGFYAYGELFRSHVRHSEARQIVICDKLEDIRPDVRLHTRFPSEEELQSETLQILKLATERVDCSCVLLLPGTGCLGVAVGILGRFMGMINIPADTSAFPNSADYEKGHCIYLQGGEVKRLSVRRLFDQLAESLEE
ncbi:HNH endonuclease [Pseudomonas sp. Fl4BN1]|uniref:HNH endonuclease n=1 Tax=Pseudomonas sp. Fl4BN1 TaxID=2697651 RepID=UPI001378E70B|nr:HNH endonuclease [Pseudomonas sp. Fl4BN1]NBF13049.1 hypothetical protein [Pseudomonas sp. Fl4BN1]